MKQRDLEFVERGDKTCTININTQESELNDTNDSDNINSQVPCHIQIERVDVMLRLLFWVILGIVCPVAGLVFWYARKETHPKIAEAIAGGAISGCVFMVFLYRYSFSMFIVGHQSNSVLVIRQIKRPRIRGL